MYGTGGFGPNNPTGRPRVAIIGAGIAGLSAAWRLRHDADVTVFEAEHRLGGHAHTRDVHDREGRHLRIDTGFIVHNRHTYPVLLELFEELGVPTVETEMSLSVECRECGIQYAGRRPLSLLVGALRRPRLVGLLWQVRRFMRVATEDLEGGLDPELTLDGWMRERGFGELFRTHFLLPLTASVWSAPPGRALEMPAGFILGFLRNHGMLSTRRLAWRTVEGGSRTYVELLRDRLDEAGVTFRIGVPVEQVSDAGGDGVVRVRAWNDTLEFDAAVLATHADDSLRMLADPTPLQRELLGAWTFTDNAVQLHDDEALLPMQRSARASWNYRLHSCSGAGALPTVSYDLTRLQALGTDRAWLVTLNDDTVDPSRVSYATTYRHPQLDLSAVRAQERMHELDAEAGVTRIAFAGAWRRYGFHEDGAMTGAAAAEQLQRVLHAAREAVAR